MSEKIETKPLDPDAEAMRLFGYRLGCDNNHKEVAKAIENIRKILTDGGDVRINVTRRESGEVIPNQASKPETTREALAALVYAFSQQDPFNEGGGCEFEGRYVGSDERGNILLNRAIKEARLLLEKEDQ